MMVTSFSLLLSFVTFGAALVQADWRTMLLAYGCAVATYILAPR